MKTEEQCLRDIIHGAMEIAVLHGLFGTKPVTLGMLELMAEWLAQQIEHSREMCDELPGEDQELEAVNMAIIALKERGK